MPDAPFNVGVNSGMNLVSDHVSGNFLAFGFGQLWELNAGGDGKWTQMTGSRAPPAAILDPTVHQLSIDALVNRWAEDDPRWEVLIAAV